MNSPYEYTTGDVLRISVCSFPLQVRCRSGILPSVRSARTSCMNMILAHYIKGALWTISGPNVYIASYFELGWRLTAILNGIPRGNQPAPSIRGQIIWRYRHLDTILFTTRFFIWSASIRFARDVRALRIDGRIPDLQRNRTDLYSQDVARSIFIGESHAFISKLINRITLIRPTRYCTPYSLQFGKVSP
jgi:hypothetical protein